MDILRLYMWLSEARAFQTHGRETRKIATEDEEQKFNLSEFIQLDLMPQSAVEGRKLHDQ
jgi:hypothetical protein